MARLCSALLLFMFLTFNSIVVASSDNKTGNVPLTHPPWPTNSSWPDANSIEPRVYKDQKLNQVFQCLNYDAQFNLVDPPVCNTQLNQDLYGWGVRIGFYTTWLASLFANFFIHDEIRAAIDANSIFLFALEIAVVKATFHDNNLKKVDALILFLIGNGTAIGALSLWGRRTKFWYTKERAEVAKYFGGVGTYARLLLCFFLGLYGIWYWYRPFKPDLLAAGSCDPRCWTAYIFGTRVSSGIHWLFFTFALISELYWGGIIFLAFVCCFRPLRNVWRARYTKFHNRFSRIVDVIGLSKLPSDRVRMILPAINLAWYILIITIIEVTLHQNSAIGTLVAAKASTSPAQLIPFLVGVVSLARLIWVKCTGAYKDNLDKYNPFVVEEEESHLLEDVGNNERGLRTRDSK